jgi:hypothetical protein
MKHILLISYTFPPYPGVGGRRWAKFAKYLAKANYTVHVIFARNPYRNTSFYTSDVQHDRIKLYAFRSFCPTILQNIQPGTLFEKIEYKFWMKLLPLFVKGFVYDKAIFDKKKVLSLAKIIIKANNIKNIITTGAPFRLNYYSLELKKEFKDIYLINDFRDPWTWGNQYSKLNTERKNFELFMLHQVIEQSDLITVPVEPMKKYLVENNPAYAGKVHVLPHAFDEDEIVVKHEYRKNSFRCVFFGTMYSGIEDYFETLCDVVAKNKGKITLDIFPDIIRYNNIIEKNKVNEWVKYHKPLSGISLFETLSQYDYVVFIYPYYVKDYLSTKFYEVIKAKIPIIYIGEQGIASEYISSNKLGLHFNAKKLSVDFQDFIDEKLEWEYNDQYNVDEFSFTQITKKLTEFFA